jgi:hypothetical protein
MASASSFHPTEGKMVSEKRIKAENNNLKQKGPHKGKAEPHIPQMFSTATKPKTAPAGEPGTSKKKHKGYKPDNNGSGDKQV